MYISRSNPPEIEHVWAAVIDRHWTGDGDIHSCMAGNLSECCSVHRRCFHHSLLFPHSRLFPPTDCLEASRLWTNPCESSQVLPHPSHGARERCRGYRRGVEHQHPQLQPARHHQATNTMSEGRSGAVSVWQAKLFSSFGGCLRASRCACASLLVNVVVSEWT